jgi:hypothetical protein
MWHTHFFAKCLNAFDTCYCLLHQILWQSELMTDGSSSSASNGELGSGEQSGLVAVVQARAFFSNPDVSAINTIAI